MAEILVPSTFTLAASPLDDLFFAPVLDKLRPILSDKGGGYTDLDDLFRAYNHLLGHGFQRGFSCIFDDELVWTDYTTYNSANQISWRQPFSLGVQCVNFRVYVKTDDASGAELRIQGNDGNWVTETVPFNGGAYQMIDFSAVECGSAWPALSYFSPVLQGKVTNNGQKVIVRSIAAAEVTLTTIPREGINPQDTEPGYSDPTFGMGPGVGGAQADEPLSADEMFELSNGCSTMFHRRTRLITVRILADGQGAHPNSVWTAAGALPDPVEAVHTGTLGVIGCRSPSVWSLKDRPAFKVMVEAKGDGVTDGVFRIADVLSPDSDRVSLTWDTTETSFSWKEGTLTPVSTEEGLFSNYMRNWYLSVEESLEVRNFCLYVETV